MYDKHLWKMMKFCTCCFVKEIHTLVLHSVFQAVILGITSVIICRTASGCGGFVESRVDSSGSLV